MSDKHCPTRNQLAAYALGTLGDTQFEEVADHLETCVDCGSTMESLDCLADDVLAGLREPPSKDDYVHEPEYRSALPNVLELGAPSPPLADADRTTSIGDPTELEQFGPYRILAKLGSGGMGTVYKAVHTNLDKLVALKILSAAKMNEQSAVLRFQREMKAVGKLNHVNIVQAYDAGEDQGVHFLALEYCDGVDLGEVVHRLGPLALADACELIRRAALGLQHAYEQELIHRDVNPFNLILTTPGELKILDFGLALLREQNVEKLGDVTYAGQIMGTLDFMAPEQGFDSHEVDIRADIYALGTTLYMLLAGSPPFAGRGYTTPLKICMAMATQPIPPIVDRRPDVPGELATVLDRMLAKRAEDRFSTPAEVANAVEAFTEGCDLQALLARAKEASKTSVGPRPTIFGDTAKAPQGALDIDQSPATASLGESTPTPKSAPTDGQTQRATKRRRMVRVACVAAVFLLTVGALLSPPVRKIIIRDKEGNVRAEIDVPTQDTIEIQDGGSSVRIPGQEARGNRPGMVAKRGAGAPGGRDLAAASLGSRVTGNLVLLYLFDEREGTTVHDTSNVGEPLDLKIANEDAIQWLPEGGLALEDETIVASTKIAAKVIAACQESNELTIEAWIRPTAADQHGPARIVSLSQGTDERNFTLGHGTPRQRNRPAVTSLFECRLRTTKTQPNGWPGGRTPEGTARTGLTHVVNTRDQAGNARIYIDGVHCVEYLVAGDFSNSDAGCPLCLGNEATEDRPWLGEYYLVAIYNRALTEQEVSQNFTATTGRGIRVGLDANSQRAMVEPTRHPDAAAWKAILGANAPPPAVAPFDAATAKKHQQAWAEHLGVPSEWQVELPGGEKLTMVLIPPGEFVMGSTEEEQARFLEEARDANDEWAIGRIPSEGPQHRVRITRPFRLSRTEVTRRQFRQFVEEKGHKTEAEQDGKGGFGYVDGKWVQDPQFVWNTDLGFPQMDEHPVVNVSWNDAFAFCQWLSEKEGAEYVLPTEAQWEYACRAGTTTAWYCGDSDTTLEESCWFGVNSGGTTHAAGQLKPNGWSLCDMYGNVWEWCADRWGSDYYTQSPPNDPSGPPIGSSRVFRGGDWNRRARHCRSAHRINSSPVNRYGDLGFRLASVLAEKSNE